ncbi:hypothetical protein PBT90_00510 [Algoriphagus halophytocola]|uniref:Uncharacterized protein n=1 Tax=Algoriphagus halophytocola TaxID=2991499 RepID=A0ABY6MDT5_9BACT|nr:MULTISPECIES: hypothetical protein [unclassified Algoriphagus]UZD21938.1 hypothetical protein OM944_14835 [Algoriphagus sp. TR-M5]WBL43189.1 hypothetical protein PBT90_00510 [Algoriphagus sp. TR-M9]
MNYHLKFLLLTAGICALTLLLQWILPSTIHPAIWTILSFLAVTSYLIGVLSIWLLKGSAENLLQIKMLGMILRIIASLSFIGIMVYLGTENILLFVADFFVVFLFYLVFDIYTFLANLRPISK